jgi:carbamoyl-phosphate synthase large subunit
VNVLISSLSRKVPLLTAFREAGATVWGGDVDSDCVGRYFADGFWEMPPISAPDAAEQLRSFCAQREIGLVIPTRDGELPFFAAVREELDAYVPIGTPEAVRACLDKLEFHDHCRARGISTIPTTSTLDDLDADQLVVKERHGAGSRGIAIGVDRAAAAAFAARLEEPIFQPVASGLEHSVDVYVNRDGRVVDAAPRARIRVHEGESTITETVEHPELVAAAVRLAEGLPLRGHLVIQGFADGSEATLLECNPRVGGASTLGFHAGVASPQWAMREALGETVAPQVGRYRRGVRLVRYPADRLIEA